MNKEQIEFNKQLTSLRKQSRLKSCIWGGEEKQGCSNKIVAAHSIQRGKILEGISEDGKVYFLNTVPADDLSEMKARFELEGIKKFSTFSGFCGEHDKRLFQPIEDKLFKGEERQKDLYAYRAAAKELHSNKESAELMKIMLGDALQEEDSPPHMKMFLPQILSGEMIVPDFIREEMLKLVMNDFGRAKYRNTLVTVKEHNLVCSHIKEVLEGREESKLTHQVYTFDFLYPIACSAAFIPYFNHDGSRAISEHEMVKLSTASVSNIEDCNTVFLNVIPENDKTHIMFSYFNKGAKFGSSIESLFLSQEEKLKVGLSNVMVNYVENMAVKPSYIDTMFSESEQSKLLKAFYNNILDPNRFTKVNVNLFVQ
ncbi:hypothetical protein ACEQ8A_000975 [Vibrio fluvialis]|nr:hypothetical protein [Vibrio fluvialis]ELX9691133.1 hypothetical protein [Vibrio fluvialis]